MKYKPIEAHIKTHVKLIIQIDIATKLDEIFM